MTSKQNLRDWGQRWKDHYCRMASRLDELEAENQRLRREREEGGGMTEQGRCETCRYSGSSKHDFSVYCKKIKDGMRIDPEDDAGRFIDVRVILHPYKDFGCIYHEEKPVPVKRICKQCASWECHNGLGVLETWSGCSRRSSCHEHLMTRANHFCDQWSERHG